MNTLILPDSPDTICTFTGYRPEKMPCNGSESEPYIQEIKLALQQSIELAHEYGFRHFLSGMARGFDLWAAEAVLALQDMGLKIDLWAVLPYPQMDHRGDSEWHERFLYAYSRASWTGSVESKYTPGCYQSRDRFLIDASRCVISYFDGIPGGTEYTMRYAQRLGRCGINLANTPEPYLPHIIEVRLKPLFPPEQSKTSVTAHRKKAAIVCKQSSILYLNRSHSCITSYDPEH